MNHLAPEISQLINHRFLSGLVRFVLSLFRLRDRNKRTRSCGKPLEPNRLPHAISYLCPLRSPLVCTFCPLGTFGPFGTSKCANLLLSITCRRNGRALHLFKDKFKVSKVDPDGNGKKFDKGNLYLTSPQRNHICWPIIFLDRSNYWKQMEHRVESNKLAC
jgi:hypothetical protein